MGFWTCIAINHHWQICLTQKTHNIYDLTHTKNIWGFHLIIAITLNERWPQVTCDQYLSINWVHLNPMSPSLDSGACLIVSPTPQFKISILKSAQNKQLKGTDIFTIYQNTTDKNALCLVLTTPLPMKHCLFIHKFKDIVPSIASQYSTTHNNDCTNKHYSLNKWPKNKPQLLNIGLKMFMIRL